MQHHKLAKNKTKNSYGSKSVWWWRVSKDNGSISSKIIIWTPTLIMHFLVFFCPLVEPFIIFFRQLICRVVTIILLVSHFSDVLSRSFRSRSFLFQKFEDKPCGDNTAYGVAYYTPENFVTGHFIKFDGNQSIYHVSPTRELTLASSLRFSALSWQEMKWEIRWRTSHAKPNRDCFLLQVLYWWKCRLQISLLLRINSCV